MHNLFMVRVINHWNKLPVKWRILHFLVSSRHNGRSFSATCFSWNHIIWFSTRVGGWNLLACGVQEARTDDLMVPSDLKCYAFIRSLNQMSLNLHFMAGWMPEKAGKTHIMLAALGYAVNPVKYGAGMGQPSLHSVGILHLKPSLS